MPLFRFILLILAATPCASAQAPIADPELVVRDLWQNWKEYVEIHETADWNGDPLPLLPMIFFDEPGSTVIPERYHRFADHDATRDYVDTAMLHVAGGTDDDIDDNLLRCLKYYEVLDILGYRMTRSPGTTITLRGGYAAETGESAAVATARAKALRSYLTTVWKIPSKRITIATPSRESEPAENDISHAEARRVAIETTTWDLFAPVPFTLMKRSVLTFSPRIGVVPNIPVDRIRSIEIVVTGGDREIARAAVPPEMIDSLHDLPTTWTFASREPSIGFDTVRIEAVVTDRDGVVRRSKAFVSPVRVSRRDRDMREQYGYRSIFLRIPFFTYRDSVVSPYQAYLIRSFNERHPIGRQVVVSGPWFFEISERAPSHDSLMRLIADVYQPVEASFIPANGSMVWSGLHVHHPSTLPLQDEVERARWTALVALNGRMVESRFKDSYDLMGKELPKVSFPSRYAGVSTYLRGSYGVTDFWSTGSGMPELISYSYGTLPEARLYDRMVTMENHSSHD